MKKHTFSILVLIMLIVSAFLSGCGSEGQSKDAEEKEITAIPVEVSQVKKGSISAVFSGTANLEAENEATVVAKVSGVIEKINVEEGDYVRKGQILARLDDEQLEFKLNQVKANLEKIKNDFQRSRKLYEKSLISADAFDKVKYEFQALKAAYDLARLELDYAGIRAPISGVIAERVVKEGNMININQPTFKITDFDPLHAILHVPERHMSKLKKGQEVDLKADAINGNMFRGTIKRISPVVDAATGTFKVTIEVADRLNKLKPGMFGRVNIIYDIHDNTNLVPKESVITEDKESAVFVVQDSIALKKIVKTGYVNSSHIEILSGLREGDTVVTIGQASLKDSARVHVISQFAVN